MGAIEFHAEHLPLGTDGFTAQAVIERAARRVGGVVLPWTATTMGTLHLPWSLRYDRSIVEASLRSTLEQLVAHAARVLVVHTGHAPLDLIHLIKRVCSEVEAAASDPAVRAYGLCYLELNAALGTNLGSDWPVAVDHGSIMETSWVMAVEPDLVALDRLPEDPAATSVGVYGPNPRTRASASTGSAQLEACAGLLAERATRLLAGERIDPLADLRRFVADYWPEPMELGPAPTSGKGIRLELLNAGPVSRYLTSLELTVDGVRVDGAAVTLLNTARGESGMPVPAASLGPEQGFYVRRGQAAVIDAQGEWEVGSHAISLALGLAGVASAQLGAAVRVG
jgi:creatinine amidohydrolase